MASINLDSNNFLHLDPESNLNISYNCSSYTINEFNSKFENYSKNYSVYNHNVQSFHAKASRLQSFFNVLNHKFDCIVLTETWNSADNVNLCHLENYSAVHTFRKPVVSHRGGPGGGVSIFCDSNLYRINKIDQLSVCNDTIESCVAEISSNDDPSQNHAIVAIYRPHTDSIENFTEQLFRILSDSIISNKSIIIAGDMNVNISASNNTATNEYLNILSSLHFIPAITIPTRHVISDSGTVSTTLDHIFLNKLTPFHSAVFDYDLSDHCGTAILFDEYYSNDDKMYKLTFRPFTKSNLRKFEAKLRETDWDTVLESEDINIQFDKFVEHLDGLYCNCFPLKTKQISAKRRANPWVTDLTLQKIRQKSIYYRLMKIGLISKAENNRLKNRLNKEIQRDKKNYYLNLFNDAKQNMKKTWKTLNSLLGSKSQEKNDFLHNINSEGEKIRVLNKFNNFFASIGSSLASKFSDDSENHQLPNLSRSENTFFLFPASENEILDIISKLKITKSNVNSLPVSLLKRVAPIVISPLLRIIQNSFQLGIFPEKLKVARITPLHKSGDTSDPSNYRPISTLSFYSKIFEKLMAKRILSFCKKFSIISPDQFGFQPGISTCDALVKLSESIYRSLDEKNHHIVALIDIKKAFDSVNHNKLLIKLDAYGIRGLALSWLRSYLSNRKCFIEINDIKSDVLTFNVGVPQGSVLGPILFLLYVNDLPSHTQNAETVLFADDTTLSTSRSDYSELVQLTNNELDNVSKWTTCNQLTLNTDKTELMIITNRIYDSNLNFKFQSDTILPTSHCKFLGVILDNKLTFRNHIDSILTKISRHSGILYKIRNNLPFSTRLNYYFAFIYPYLSYNVIVWGGTYKTHLNPLITFHKRIIRIICDAGYRDHTNPLYKKLNILKFEDIYKYNVLIYMFKARREGEYLVEHNRVTRNRDIARSTYHRTELSQHAVSYTGPKIWNSMPSNVTSIQKLGQFKQSIKKIFIDGY